jgi:hypothetical protein
MAIVLERPSTHISTYTKPTVERIKNINIKARFRPVQEVQPILPIRDEEINFATFTFRRLDPISDRLLLESPSRIELCD